jgi:beta-lactamase class D
VFLGSGTGPRRRRGRRRDPRRWGLLLVVLLVLAAIGVAAVFVQRHRQSNDRRRAAVREYVAAWEQRDVQRMWELTSPGSRPSLPGFERLWEESDRAAGVRAVDVGSPSALSGGKVTVPVTVRTTDFGTLEGPMELETADVDGKGRIVWSPRLRLPGLRGDEIVRRKASEPPPRGEVLAADGSRLADTVTGAGIAGTPGDKETDATGLERIYNARLGGRPAESLRFGSRVIRRVKEIPGRDVHTTISLGLTQAAENALGSQLGGVAVIRPRDGAVVALAGLAVSAPQPPGSTFKIVTTAGALQEGIATPERTFPVSQYAVLSGVKLYNASSESCGGSLTTSFIHSCNSVFAPLGAELGAKRLVEVSEKFGFNTTPKVPAAKPSTIVRSDLKDDLAVGAAAIGQNRDLATPLQMASVGATIANGGVRVEPRIIREEPRKRQRAVSKAVAGQVRDMMVGVVAGGTGTAGALPGVTVAGKTGTAELVPTHGGAVDPKDTDAWFVAFAPAQDPQLAIAVMIVGGGFGGDSAAPVARAVLGAGL